MEPTNPQIPDFSGADAASLLPVVVGLIFILIGIAVMIFIMLTLQKHYEAIGPEHREFDPPGKVWMLLIPLFQLYYWMFIVYPGLGRSYRKALAAKGISDAGDGGEKLGLWLAIVTVTTAIPIIQFIGVIAYVVLLIMFLVRMADQKRRLLAAG